MKFSYILLFICIVSICTILIRGIQSLIIKGRKRKRKRYMETCVQETN